MDKQQIRQHYLKIRNDIPDKKEKSRIISEKIMNHPRYQEAKIIGLYIAKPEEVDLTSVISDALAKGKTVVIPRVKNFNLEFYKFDPHSTLIRSKFGILEPNPCSERINPKEISVYFVPAVSFDINGNRIGFGQGHFDRALKDLDTYKVGICFKDQMYHGEIPTYGYDVKMDEIIHE